MPNLTKTNFESCKNCQNYLHGGIVKLDSKNKCVKCGKQFKSNSEQGGKVDKAVDKCIRVLCQQQTRSAYSASFLTPREDFKEILINLLAQQQSELLERVEKLKRYACHYPTCIIERLQEFEAAEQGFEYKCGCGLNGILESLDRLIDKK